MAIWNSKIMQQVTNGVITADWECNNLIMNSKDISEGDIFVALPGSKVDGHDFVSAAYKNGASAAIVNRKIDEDIPQLIVPNVYEAIKKLAHYKRKTVKAHYIAITGSVGKTTTKEMLAQCLKSAGRVYATKGNFNNHLGLPLTMASIPNDAEYVICELGMSAAGEIKELSLMLKPDYAIITNVYPVHKEFFATVADIARAKAEIFAGLVSNGAAILNADNNYYHILKEEAERTKAKLVSCGQDQECQILNVDTIGENVSDIKAKIFDQHLSYKMATNSSHLISNSLFILALSAVLNINLNPVLKILDSFSDCEGRGELIQIEKSNQQITIIDDSYNSSPDSLKASLARLKLFKEKRKIAVLSDMLELGSETEFYHIQVAEHINNNEINKVITYGKHMKKLYEQLKPEKQMYHAETLELLEKFLTENILTNDIILFKGSHGTGLYKLIKSFKEA